jgi:septal ring factor EnvC (AmiA/AmiB activator)
MASPSKASPTKSMPVYSDFSHMTAKQGIGGIRFAVSLREENPDELIARVFPMTKIVPGVVKEKKVRKVEKKVEEKTCTRPDCTARKEKMVELQNENKNLRLKLKALEDRIETARNKITLTEKSIIMTEEKNDVLNGQIEDAQQRIFTIEADVEKGEKINSTLRRQLSTLQADIERIKTETEDQNSQLRDMMDSKSEQKLVFSRDPKHKNPQLASEVSVLRFPTDGDDSD